MAWLVVILIILIGVSLVLALKYLVFKTAEGNDLEKNVSQNKVVIFLTIRILLSAILLSLCYLYLNSLS
jgi:hypothetical protein